MTSVWLEFDPPEEGYGDPFEEIRALLDERYAQLPADELEGLLEGWLDELSPEELEGFLSGLKKVVSTVGGVAKKALPGVIAGASSGAALGPYGMLAGALLGGAGSALGSGAPAKAPAAPTGRAAAARPGGSPAAAQLTGALLRPETLQALLAMLLGGAGRSQVKVGGTPVPTAAFTNLLATLARQATAQANAVESWRRGRAPGEVAAEEIPEYLLDEAGEVCCDPAVPEERAARLLDLLYRSPVPESLFGEADEAVAVTPEEEYGDFEDALDEDEAYWAADEAYWAAEDEDDDEFYAEEAFA